MRIITFSLCFLTALWNSGLLSWAMMLANHLETIWTAWNTLGSEGIFWKGKIKCISRAKGIWSGPIHISSFFMILWSMESMVAMVKWFSFADACSPAVLRSAQVSCNTAIMFGRSSILSVCCRFFCWCWTFEPTCFPNYKYQWDKQCPRTLNEGYVPQFWSLPIIASGHE